MGAAVPLTASFALPSESELLSLPLGFTSIFTSVSSEELGLGGSLLIGPSAASSWAACAASVFDVRDVESLKANFAC